MSNLFETALKLQAQKRGRALQIASNLSIGIQPHAMILVPIKMAGEDTSIHAIATGNIGGAPTYQYIPEPRNRDQQEWLFERLATQIQEYLAWCFQQDVAPQFWVVSPAAVNLFATISERLRSHRTNQKLKFLGNVLAYLCERFHIGGQQIILPTTDVLKSIWITGQSPEDDGHLKSLLTWVNPPQNRPIKDALLEAEQVPMGATPEPNFDIQVTLPRLEAYKKAVKNQRPKTEIVQKAQAIGEGLFDVILPIFDAIQFTIHLIQSTNLPPLIGLEEIEEQEHYAFKAFMEYISNDGRIPIRDGSKAAIFKLSQRQDSQENFYAVKVLGDHLIRTKEKLSGSVVFGRVLNPRKVLDSGRKYLYQFELHSTQKHMRLRRGDSLYMVSDPRLQVLVENIQRENQVTLVSFTVQKGMRIPGLPQAGTEIELVTVIPDWSRLTRMRQNMSQRMQNPVWTHTPNASPPIFVKRPNQYSNNLLSQIEELSQ